MSAMFPIFPTAGLGQSVPASSETLPAADGEIFAEVLTAALMVPASIPVSPNQQNAAMPTGASEVGLVDAALMVEALEAEAIPSVSEGQSSGNPGTNTGSRLHSEFAAEQLKATSDSDRSDADNQPSSLNRAFDLMRRPGHEGAVVDADNPDLAATIPTKTDTTHSMRADHLTPDIALVNGENLIDEPVAIVSPTVNEAEAPIRNDGRSSGSPIAFQPGLSGDEVHLTQKLQDSGKIQAPTLPVAPALPETSSAALPSDQQQRSTRPATPLPPATPTGDAALLLPKAATATPHTNMDGLSEAPDRQHLQRPTSDVSIEPVEAALQRGLTQLPAGLHERPSTSSRAPAGNRQTAASIASSVNPSIAITTEYSADPGHPIATENLEGRPQALSAVPVQSTVNPTSNTIIVDTAQQPSIAEAGARQGNEIGSADRFQPLLVPEGEAQSIERFEQIVSASSARMPSLSAHPSTGMQIAMQIARSAPGGVDRISLQLHPAELGSVDIQMNFEGAGKMSALITVERPETLELLQRDSRSLERSLSDSGIKLSGDGLSFTLKQDQQQQQPGQNFHEEAQARQAAFRAGRAYDDASEVEQAPSTRRVEGLRLLDIET